MAAAIRFIGIIRISTACYGGIARNLRAMAAHIVSRLRLTAASESPFANGVAGILTFAEKLLIRHNWLPGVLSAPVLNIGLIVRDSDHETRRFDRQLPKCLLILHEQLPRGRQFLPPQRW
jgi:hypothetical protein